MRGVREMGLRGEGFLGGINWSGLGIGVEKGGLFCERLRFGGGENV